MKKALTIDRRRQGILLGLTEQPQKQRFCLLLPSCLLLLTSFIPLFLLAVMPSFSYAYVYFSIAHDTWNGPEAWCGGVMLKSYVRTEEVVNIRHNIPYNLPKYPIVKEKINIRRKVYSKNIVEKILSRNIYVKLNRSSSKTPKKLQKTAPWADGDACNTFHWNDGGVWSGSGCVGANDGEALGGIIRVGNSSDTQSGVDNNTT